jgi:hypothetical protein
MVAAEKGSVLLEAVSDDATSALLTTRGQGMDRALEAIEDVLLAAHHDLERLVVIVPAVFTCRHIGLFVLLKLVSFKDVP